MTERRRFNDRERFALYRSSGGVCSMCGCLLEPGWHADHVEPYSKGGLTDVINGQALCVACNLTKGARMDTRIQLREWQRDAIAVYQDKNATDFLMVATPGAGKTTFALSVAQRELEIRRVARVIVIAPLNHLRTQWKGAASNDFGIQLDAGFDNGTGAVASDYDGIVTTYQSVSSNPDVYRLLTSQKSTLVIFDEIHHAGDRSGWGVAIRSAFTLATRRLSITGTPFRSDNRQIPFVNYGPDGSVSADKSYTYKEALRDGVVREVYFHTFEGDFEWWSDLDKDGSESRRASFADDLSERESSERLRTALSVETDWLPKVILEADQQLRSVREHDFPDAGGLVIAMNRQHALKIADLMKRTLGEAPLVAISDNPTPEDPDPSRVIDRFANGDPDILGDIYRRVPRWLVAVKMVSEGIDIPRLCVGVYATNVLSELFFRQAVGRFVRVIAEVPGIGASVFLPKEPTLIAHVASMTAEREHAISEMEDEERKKRGPGPDKNPSLFEPIQANALRDTVYIGDEAFIQDEVTEIRKFMLANGMEGMAIELGLKFYRKAQQWFMYTHGGTITTTPVETVIERATKPLQDEKQDLRSRITRAVNRLSFASGLEHKAIHGTLNFRTSSKAATATKDQLLERIDMLRDWQREANATPGMSPDAWVEVMRRGR